MENSANPKQSAPVNNFYGNINNYNVYNAPVKYEAPVNNYNGGSITDSGEDLASVEKVATKEMMSRAAKLTLEGGYWKSQRSWSVIFVVYCIWGYKGRVSDFLTEVLGWPDDVAKRIICNRDAVEKLKNTYNFTKDVNEWRKNGVPEQYCILGEQLESELMKMKSMAEE